LTVRKGPRGLASIAQIRGERAASGPRWTTAAGATAGLAVVAGLLTHMFVSAHELNAGRQALLAKQRAVVATLGAEWFPLRDAIESDVLLAAKSFDGDEVLPSARSGAFRSQPGIYLRMRLADATAPQRIREVAAGAKRDAFAACLLRERNDRGLRGELDGGAFAEQPWNLGQAYAATRILTPEWAQDVQAADEDLRLRVFVEQYDKAIRDEIPLAIDVIKRAQFFLLVLDEDVAEGTPADGGAMTEESLQLVEHPARIWLFDLTTQHAMMRLRRSSSARVLGAGERPVTDDETRDAMQRQANNCSLANAVQLALR